MDKARLLREIQAARDLAQSLERNKEQVQKNLTVALLENQQFEANLKSWEMERENLMNEMKAEVIFKVH